MPDFLAAGMLLFVLLNPFFVIVYITDLVEKLDSRTFFAVMTRAGLISGTVFSAFALAGDALFSDVLRTEFASFQIFGGIVFLLIGIRFVFHGMRSVEILRGESAHVAGAVAMPVFIGPGTLSASVVIGKRLDPLAAVACVLLAVGASIALMAVLKAVHDYVRPRNEALVERYIEVAGRIVALYVGTFSVEMIMTGLRAWAGKF